MLARAERTAIEHLAAEVPRPHFQHFEVDEPVVDSDPVAHSQLMHHVFVVDMDALFLGVLRRGHAHRELFAHRELEIPAPFTGANGGSLQIEQHRNRMVQGAAEVLYVPNCPQVAVMVPVRHVEPSDVHPGSRELLDAVGRIARGSKRANDLGLSEVASVGHVGVVWSAGNPRNYIARLASRCRSAGA